LFERLGIHEDEGAGLIVEKLGVQFFDIGHLQLVATLEGSIQDRVSYQILELALVERIPFTRLDEVDFVEEVWFAINLNFETLSEVAGFVRCHGVFG
jgi:hypothetical protein